MKFEKALVVAVLLFGAIVLAYVYDTWATKVSQVEHCEKSGRQAFVTARGYVCMRVGP